MLGLVYRGTGVQAGDQVGGYIANIYIRDDDGLDGIVKVVMCFETRADRICHRNGCEV